jgi:hypothetical protein
MHKKASQVTPKSQWIARAELSIADTRRLIRETRELVQQTSTILNRRKAEKRRCKSKFGPITGHGAPAQRNYETMESPFHIDALVKGAFSSEELAFLNQQPAFATVCAAAKSDDDFGDVCEIGERLLANCDMTRPLPPIFPLPAPNNILKL